MAASYPTTVKTFSTKATNDTIEASHVNDLQAEITALEDGLINALGHDLKFTDATFDIGKSGASRPRDLFLSRNLTVGGAATFGTITLPTLAQHLLFTDATYDIGASGATRPRDFFFSRNGLIGGTLGVTGTTTLAALIASGTITPQGLVDASGAAAGQFKFPATQNASSNANTLDDYDERSWTPVLGGAGGTTGQTYTTQVGRSVKIGRIVCASFAVTLSAKGTITGAVQIQGFPYTADANVGASAGLPYYISLNTNWVSLGGYLFPSSTALALYGNTAAAATVTALATGDITNTTEIRGTVIYLAAA